MTTRSIPVAIEASIVCHGCREPIPLRAMEARVRCPACGAACTVSWASLLTIARGDRIVSLVDAFATFSPGDTLAGAAPETQVDIVLEHPVCGGCRAPWDDALLALINARTRAMACTTCGREEPARLPPAKVVQELPSARWIVGEVAPATHSPLPPGQARPCAGCGAALGPEACTGPATCTFCGAVTIPRDVRPSGSARHRFYVFFRAET